MHPCFRAAVAILYLQSATAATDSAAAITRLENMCEHAGDFKPDQLEDAAVETERAIRTHAAELNSPRIYVGDMWDVSHRLASRYPKFSLKFAQDALEYIDRNWPTSDIGETERYRIWSAMLEAYVTLKQWEAAARLSDALLRAIAIGAAPADMFSGPAIADIHARYASALAGLGRRIEAADHRRIAAGDRTPMMKVRAPEFLLADLNGHSVGINDFEGQARVVVFWASWCTPCHAEMESLKTAQLPAKLLTIATDSVPADVRAFVREHGYSYTVLFSDGKVDQAYEVEALPKVFVVDKDGYIRAMRQGADPQFIKRLAADLATIGTRSR